MASDKELGVDALNRDFKRYEQVTKEQSYRLAESAEDELFDDQFRIQVCSLGWLRSGDDQARQQFVHDLGSAMERIGFAILVDHGIAPEIWEEGEAKALEAFTSLGLEEKMRFRAERHGSVSQGYFPIKETSEIHPDLVEGWVFCRRAFDLAEREDVGPYREADFWPRADLEPTFRRLVEVNEELILPLMRSILEYLSCDGGLYDRRLTNTNFGLRLNYYPPIGEAENRSGAGRLLGHEDVDLFTILPAPKVEGLQVLNRENGRWIRLDPPPGSIVLNTGDYMQRITNDRLPSTTHRVSKPRDSALLEVPRISLRMAVYVWEDEILEVLPGLPDPKYEPIKAITFHTRSTSKFYGDDYAVDE